MVSYSDIANVTSQAAALSSASTSSGSYTPSTKQELGAEVVTQTLNLMNNQSKSFGGKSNDISPSFDTQMTILSAGLMKKGGIVSSTG